MDLRGAARRADILLLSGGARFRPSDFEDLEASAAPPDPLQMLNGDIVAIEDAWWMERRLDVAVLFRHHVYGYPAAAPDSVSDSGSRDSRWPIADIAGCGYGLAAFHQSDIEPDDGSRRPGDCSLR